MASALALCLLALLWLAHAARRLLLRAAYACCLLAAWLLQVLQFALRGLRAGLPRGAAAP